MSKATKAQREKAAAELSLSIAEYDAIVAFVEVFTNRLNEAPTEPLVSAIDTHLRTKMPHNEEATNEDALNSIEFDAAGYVIDNILGGSIESCLFRGTALSKAKGQVETANGRLLNSAGDEKVESYYAGRLRWLTQLQCQVAMKETVQPLFEAVYALQTGKQYEGKQQAATPRVVADASLALLMK